MKYAAHCAMFVIQQSRSAPIGLSIYTMDHQGWMEDSSIRSPHPPTSHHCVKIVEGEHADERSKTV